MSSGFTETFTGNTISPSQIGYANLTISANITLSWPFEKNPLVNAAANITGVTATLPGLSVQCPNATLVSPGQTILFVNNGGNAFTVLDNAGNNIGSVASGQMWLFWITDNTLPQGIWQSIQLGIGTSVASAASLAGAGLLAILTRLNQNLIINTQQSNYSLTQADLSTVVRNAGGAVTYTPNSAGASAGQLPNGWFVYLINNGSGTLTFAPQGGQTIDGSATKNLNPGESAIFFSDGSNFWTLGYGRSIVSTVSAINIPVPSTGSLNLSSAQAAAQVQNYTGTMTSNVTVNYGTGAGFWFVWNNTTGAFNLTFAVNGSDPGVTVPQGSFSILRSDGSNMHIAFTATSGTVTNVSTTSDLVGGPITTTGVLGLSNTGVTAGAYGGAGSPPLVPVITVTAVGRITAASTYALGTMANTTVGNAAGQLPVLGSDNNFPSLNGGVPVGAVFDYAATTPPAGYLLAFGTIGTTGSGASNRANPDQINLFTLIWNNWANAQAPVSGGRGASAAADFAAAKTIAIPDLRGRVVAGLDNMGGVAAGRLTSTSMSPNATTMGATGGIEVLTSFLVNGATSGSLSVSGSTGNLNGASVTVLAQFQGNFGGGGTNVYGINNPSETVNLNSGSLSISGNTSGALSTQSTTGTITVVPPTMVMSKIVKY